MTAASDPAQKPSALFDMRSLTKVWRKGEIDSASRGGVAARRLEQLFLVSGVALLAAHGSAVLAGQISSKAVADFEAAQATGHRPAAASVRHRKRGPVDFSQWDKGRVQAYLKSLTEKQEPAIGILRIRRLGIEVPVFEGTDSLTLDRGAGHIEGTDALGGNGNSGIAGHRDGFFRGLKDIAVGDRIELLSADRTVRYEVRETRIVQPTDIGVLMDRGAPTLTLVTCFPFYVVGDAKERFIVWATPTDALLPADSGGTGPKQVSSKSRTQGEK